MGVIAVALMGMLLGIMGVTAAFLAILPVLKVIAIVIISLIAIVSLAILAWTMIENMGRVAFWIFGMVLLVILLHIASGFITRSLV